LEESVKRSDEEMAQQIQLSQSYVAQSEEIAKQLTASTSVDELERLGNESNRVVGLAEQTARGIVSSRAEAAGLRCARYHCSFWTRPRRYRVRAYPCYFAGRSW
jgi:hypothetical protein